VSLSLAAAPILSDSLSPLGIALVIAFLVVSLGIHEAAHGWVALKCGDTTARDLGRITLNPIPHIDLFMTILLPTVLYLTTGFIFGGAKPVPVNYYRLRNPLRDMSLVALAGPASNFLLAILFYLAWKWVMRSEHYAVDSLLPMVMLQAASFNVLLATFNLIPIPPLDGSRVMAWLLPESLRASYVSLERFGILIVFAVIYFVPGFNAMLSHAMDGMWRLINTLTGGAW
jgi:Zn-dependent protease